MKNRLWPTAILVAGMAMLFSLPAAARYFNADLISWIEVFILESDKQDGRVLTYDSATRKFLLEAPAGSSAVTLNGDVTGDSASNVVSDISIITTRGDQLIGNSSGNAVRAAIGASGRVWASDGTDPSWTAFGGDVTGAPGNLQLGAGVVDENEIATGGVNTAELEDNGVALGDMAQIATDTLLGRYDASTGNVQVVTPDVTYFGLASGALSLNANSLDAGVIAANAIGNSEMADDAIGSSLAEIADNTAARVLGWNDAGAPALFTAGTNVSFAGGSITVSGVGSGDVVGPASSVDNELVRFHSTTGKIIQAGAGTPTLDDSGNVSSTVGLTADLYQLNSTPVAAAVKLDNEAQGQLLMRNASGWWNLRVGTAGQALISGGAGADDVWTSSGGDVTGVYSNLQLGSGVVDEAEIATGGVNTAEIEDAGVAFADFQNLTTDSLFGRDAAGSGVGTNITLNATYLSMNGSNVLGIVANSLDAAVIAANAIAQSEMADDAVGLPELAHGTANRFVIYNGSGVPAEAALSVTSDDFAGDGIATALSIPDNAIETADVEDNAITLAKVEHLTANFLLGMDGSGVPSAFKLVWASNVATGTDGEIPTWDASGNAAVVAVGTAGHVLTSGGAGVAPTFQAGGKLKQVVTASTSARILSTTSIPTDDSIPGITEGASVLTRAITPTSSTSTLFIIAKTFGAPTAAVEHTSLALNDGTNTIQATQRTGAQNYNGQLAIYWHVAAGSTSSRTYEMRAGTGSGGQLAINSENALNSRVFGGVANTIIWIFEVGA